MTNELKPCPWAVGNQTHVAFWEAVNRYVRACGGDTSGFNSTHRMSAVVDIEAIVFSIARHSRPSPAPTVSVEECERVFYLAETAHESADDPTGEAIAAVHSLCVSRLTGAATRSETIELSPAENHALIAECVEIIDNELAEGNSWDAAGKVIQRCLKALASHPASVAGEARPSDDEVWTAFDDARRRAKVLRTSSQEQDAAGLRAVMELYERGAK